MQECLQPPPPPCHIPTCRPSPARFVRQAEGLVGLVGLVGLLFRRRPTAGVVMCVGAGMVTSPAPFRIRPIDFSSSFPPSHAPLVQISGHHWTTRPRDLWGPAMPRMRMRVRKASHSVTCSEIHFGPFPTFIGPSALPTTLGPWRNPYFCLESTRAKVVAVILLSRLDGAWPAPASPEESV